MAIPRSRNLMHQCLEVLKGLVIMVENIIVSIAPAITVELVGDDILIWFTAILEFKDKGVCVVPCDNLEVAHDRLPSGVLLFPPIDSSNYTLILGACVVL